VPKPPAAATPRPTLDTTAVAVATLSAFVALVTAVGADSRWLAALGRVAFQHHSIPDRIPYAAAPSAGWPNVPALGELVFYVFALAGDRGLLLAQLLAVAAALSLLAWDLRRGGGGRGAPIVLAVVAVGALSSLIAIRGQLFSLALFPLTLTLLRAEARQPSRRIWLLVPLVAVWSNLHGAVLVGLATAAAYLLLDRAFREPFVALGALAASGVALFATPALLRTGEYYHSVMENEAARRGFGLWAPLSLHAPLDVLAIAAAAPLVALALRSRLPRWELGALAGLAVLTVQSGRGAVWLLFLLALPAARGLRAEWLPARVHRIISLPVIAVVALAVARGPYPLSAGDALVRSAIAQAAGTPILAESVPAEQLALAGGTVWMANPLDAFPHGDQRLYLDWLQGRPAGDAALARARVVLVMRGSRPQRRLATSPSFRELGHDAHAVLYSRDS
jgi:hypothetical protein